MDTPATTAAKNVSDRQLLWAVPVAMALHNLEEGLGIRWMAPGPRLAEIWRQTWGPGSGREQLFYLALTILTLAVFALAACGRISNPRGRGARSLVLIQLLMLINAVWHLTAALALRGYAPGLATALLLQAPLAWAVLRRSWRERWLSHWATLAAALLLTLLHSVPAIVLIVRLRSAS